MVSDIISRFGGVREMARILELNPSSVCRWQERGFIPQKRHAKILALAKAYKIKVKKADLYY
jgi:hypothetical protein